MRNLTTNEYYVREHSIKSYEIAFLLQMTTVKVSNVSLGATDQDLKEFFSFSGDILYLETQRFGFLSTVFLLKVLITALSSSGS